MKQILPISLLSLALVLLGCSPPEPQATDAVEPAIAAAAAAEESASIDAQVADYIQKFPYQDTYNYAAKYTGSDPAKLNTWVLGAEPQLVKAGDDTVVRMNNDTYYKMAFLSLEDGPVVLGSDAAAQNRFTSFQLMDDRNVNYRNIINPDGSYTFYYGEKPEQIQGEAVEVPSSLSVIIVRVEVKDENDAADVAAAKAVFNGITIAGESPAAFPQLDLLSAFPADVATEANRLIDETFTTVPFTQNVVGPTQVPGKDVAYLNLAAGTKGGWGGPDPAHSAYDTIFFDKNDAEMKGSNGAYTVTTEEPPVDAFWSITVYDTDRGGYLHPNKDNRYHINNTGAVRNDDGTVTFTFKTSCAATDLNCLEVPAGRFDLVARYYLPHEEVISGAWVLPKLELTAG
jgi:hypothetical protein